MMRETKPGNQKQEESFRERRRMELLNPHTKKKDGKKTKKKINQADKHKKKKRRGEKKKRGRSWGTLVPWKSTEGNSTQTNADSR